MAELLAGSRPDEIAAAEATMQKAEANYAELKTGSRPEEIAASEAEFHAAEVDRDHLKRDLDRDEQLQQTDSGTIAHEQLDQAYAAYRMANERYLQAKKRYEMVKEGPRAGGNPAGQGRHGTGRGPISPRQGRAAKRGSSIRPGPSWIRPKPVCSPLKLSSATPR